MSQRERHAVPVGQIVPTILSFSYIYWWVKRANWRHWADRTGVFFLTGSLAILAVEVALEMFGRGVVEHPRWVKAVFFLIIAILLYTKFRELGARRQQASFIDAAREVTQRLSRPQGEDHVDKLVEKLVGLFQVAFERKGWTWFGLRPNAVRVNAALFTIDEQRLEIRYEHPPHQGDHGPSFSVGEGGCGYCYENNCLVYIPRKSLRHAIVQFIDDEPGDEPFFMEPGIFRSQGSRNYRSVLCVPIRAHGQRFGVLNFDSPRANAFRRIDFEQATFYGFALALVLLHAKREA